MSGPTLKDVFAVDMSSVRDDLESFALQTTEGCILDDAEEIDLDHHKQEIRSLDIRVHSQMKRAAKKGERL